VLAQGGAPHCPAGQAAEFTFGIAALQARLGATMGAPLECEHVNPENGDTIQHTTTGLAYYRPEINTPMFTDGQTHWALQNNRVILWRNASVTPPQPSATETTFLRTAIPLERRMNTLQAQLTNVRIQAESGRLDAIDVADLGTLLDELTATRDAYAAAGESDRLRNYNGMMLRSLDEARAAAELLLRARLTEIPEARAAFISEAAVRRAESERLQRAAADAFSLVLPVVVG